MKSVLKEFEAKSSSKRSLEQEVDFRREICKIHEVSYEDSVRYEKFLISRIKEVEKVIDEHLNTIKTSVIESQTKKVIDASTTNITDEALIRQAFNKELETSSYKEKLNVLSLHQDLLIESNKNDWQKRDRKQTTLRMRGSIDFSLSQSYYLLDNKHLSIVKDIYYSIGEDLQEE